MVYKSGKFNSEIQSKMTLQKDCSKSNIIFPLSYFSMTVQW